MTKEISFDDIAKLPPVGGDFPVQFSFGDGGRSLTYLYARESGLERSLFHLRPGVDSAPAEVVLAGGHLSEEGLSLEEQLRRERTRETGLGITSASWAADGDALLVPLPDGLHVVTGLRQGAGAARSVLAVARAEGAAMAPQLSPDGSMVAFVRQGDLTVAAADGSFARRLTTSATEGLTNGLSDYVAQEEMSRHEAFWWSPDGSWIAYLETDERHIPLYRIVHQASDATGAGIEETHRYPFAGEQNVRVRLLVVSVEGAESRLLDLELGDAYLVRAGWMGEQVVAQVMSRDQQHLEVRLFDPESGKGELLHQEQLAPWIDLHEDFRALKSGEWLWSNEQSGFRHLELRSRGGGLVRRLTAGDWQVDSLAGVDEQAGLVYFTGTKDGARERHLYSVPLVGGEVERITTEPGSHFVTVGVKAGVYVDRHGSLSLPPTVRLRSLADNSVLAVLHSPRDARLDTLDLVPPETVTVTADDGTKLDGLLFRAEGVGPLPLVVYLYGGPHVQLTADDWAATGWLRAQALRGRGVHVLSLDNRGARRRGLGFEAPIWHAMGQIEVADQSAGVRWAVGQGLADEKRVGVYGASYGGYLTLRCLALAPKVFKVGVAAAPVTAWDGYDTFYTERYMGHPDEEEEAYRASSVLARVKDIAGELLLVHGLIDENVHFRHTARLISRLIAEKKPYRLLLLPEERHLPRRQEDRAYLEEQVIGFLLRALSAR